MRVWDTKQCRSIEDIKDQLNLIEGEGGVVKQILSGWNVVAAIIVYYTELGLGAEKSVEDNNGMSALPGMCECGCGNKVKLGNRFLQGHHLRVEGA